MKKTNFDKYLDEQMKGPEFAARFELASEASAAIHETAAGLFEAGVIDKQTMREFDESCLTPIHEFTPQQIRALREREQVSQTVFAHHLNISKDSVSQWERGKKRPAGPSLKLLSLIERKGLASIA